MSSSRDNLPNEADDAESGVTGTASFSLHRLSPRQLALEFSKPAQLAQHFETLEWQAPSFALNLVSNQNGDFWGSTGTSRDLSNDYDYQALIGYRRASDGILTSAITARAEQYRRSSAAPLALVSKSGNFLDIPAVISESAGPSDSQVILLVARKQLRETRQNYSKPWIKVKSIGRGSAFRISLALTLEGWRRILCEAGPEFSRFLISHRVVKSINLTIIDAGETSPLTASLKALANLGVHGATLTLAETVNGTLFTQWTDI